MTIMRAIGAAGHAGTVVSSIPSPTSGTLSIGPLDIHAYGLMIALGVVAGVWLMGRRFEQKEIGTRDDANAMAIWAVLAGVIGSRLYHVITDWSKFSNNLGDIPKIWQGGLGIPGGLAAGIPVGLYFLKRRGIPVGLAANCGAPGIALAQAIGRWGNYWNQELFGGATTLPWGLEIDADKVPLGYAPGTLFHPTFLYESLSNLALCGALLVIDKRVKVRPGHLMAMYIAGYGVIRFFVEGVRIDEADHVGGLRWNQWVALAAVVGAGAYLLISLRRRPDPDGVTAADAIDDAVPEAEAEAESNPDPALGAAGGRVRITSTDVLKVAKLARLDLSPEHIDRTTAQLASMLEHFGDIDALDLDDVEPMTQPYPLSNIFRDDVVAPGLDRDEVLDAAPSAEGGRFRVPPIVGLDA